MQTSTTKSAVSGTIFRPTDAEREALARMAEPLITAKEWATALALGAGVLLLAMLTACEPGPVARSVTPSLQDVVGRVDVGRVLACAGRPDRWRCLGAEAASIAIDIAADKAEAAARAAQDALSGAGAADVDEDELAAELDAALLDLGAAIQQTHGGT